MLKLAKELRDAGFPQKPTGLWLKEGVRKEGIKEETFIPELKDLIEACGDWFWLCNEGKEEKEGEMRWHATSTLDKEKHLHTFGSTPEIAVARLWLALNTK